MSKARKLLVPALMFVLAMALGVGGTLAWLTTSTSEVKNTFTAGNIDITLKETKTDFKMIPGSVIEKDPIVTVVGGSEACWLFVKVEESSTPKLSDYIDYGMASGWIQGTGGTGEVPSNVWYREVEATSADIPFNVIGYTDSGVFTPNKVHVKETVNKGMMDAISGTGAAQPTLTITAYAVQKDNIATAADAWAKL